MKRLRRRPIPVFLRLGGEPFHAGTHDPPERRPWPAELRPAAHGRRRCLVRAAADVGPVGARLVDALGQSARITPPSPSTASLLVEAVVHGRTSFDPVRGGSVACRSSLRRRRSNFPSGGTERARSRRSTVTLDGRRAAAMYDVVAVASHRYSVDDRLPCCTSRRRSTTCAARVGRIGMRGCSRAASAIARRSRRPSITCRASSRSTGGARVRRGRRDPWCRRGSVYVDARRGARRRARRGAAASCSSTSG